MKGGCLNTSYNIFYTRWDMKQPGKLDPSFNLEIAYHVSPLGEVSDFILFIYLLIFKEKKRY